LLRRVLWNAGLGEREGEAIRTRPPRLILELGFSCGDSSLYFSTPVSDFTDADGSPCYIADKYIGLTLDPKQHDLAIMDPLTAQ
jgi:hypothetical protein